MGVEDSGTELLPGEELLVELSGQGRQCSLSAVENKVVRAEILRLLLAGLPVRAGDGAKRPLLVQLDGALIRGSLNLRGLGSPDALPPLILSDCRIEQFMSCDDCRLSSLSLDLCQFAGLSLDRSHVSGSLSIDRCSPNGSAGCGLSAAEGRFEGAVTIVDSDFVANAPFEALNMRDCTIAGSLVFGGRVRVTGPVHLDGARISGQLVLSGAELMTDPALWPLGLSLCADGIEVRGNVLAESSDTLRFRASGTVSFDGAKIGGDLIANGARLESLGQAFAFSARSAEIGGTLSFGVREGELTEAVFEAVGSVDILNSRIGDNLDLRGACLRPLDNRLALNASGVTIGHQLILKTAWLNDDPKPLRFRAEGELHFIGAVIGDDVELRGAEIVPPPGRPALAFTGARIGGQVHLCHSEVSGERADSVRTEVYGSIEMASCRVEGLLCLAGARVAPPPGSAALRLANAELGSDLELGARPTRSSGEAGLTPFEAFGEIDLVGSTVRGSIFAIGGRIQTAPASIALNLQRADVRGGVILRADERTAGNRSWHVRFSATGSVWMLRAAIGGNCDLGGGAFHAVGYPAINLANGRIGENLKLNGLRAKGEFATEITGRVSAEFLKIDGKFVLMGVRLKSAEGSAGLTLRSASARSFAFQVDSITADQVYTLDFNGFQYDDIECVRTDAPSIRRLQWLLLRLVWPMRRPLLRQYAREQLGWDARSAHIYGECTSVDPNWRHHAVILMLMFKGALPTAKEYNPQPFNQMAKALHRAGDFESERRLLSLRNRIEARFLPFSERLTMRLYGLFFDYGLSQRRALVSLLLCLAIGTLGVELALREQPVRVLKAGERAEPPARSILVREATPAAETHASPERPCGSEVEPALYAADVFIPLLDLRQEQRCTISSHPDDWMWRWAKGAYAILGWLVISLSIFTIGGFARRRAAADPA